jgi:hypothetical protein
MDLTDKEATFDQAKPFRTLYIPKRQTYLNYHADNKKRAIKKNVNYLKDDHERLYTNNNYLSLLIKARRQSEAATFLFDNTKLQSLIHSHMPTQTEPTVRHCLECTNFPKELFSYMDPLELNAPLKRRTVSANVSKAMPSRLSRPTRHIHFDDSEYYLNLARTKHDIGGVDFRLIQTIHNKQKQIDEKLMELNYKEKEYHYQKKKHLIKKILPKKKTKLISKNHMHINYKYVPMSNKYKEISFAKNCIFEGDFNNNSFTHYKQKRTLTEATITSRANTSNNNVINDSIGQSIHRDAGTIHNNLKSIRKVLKRDKKFYHNSIERTMKRRRNDINREETLLRKEIKKDIYHTLYIKNKGYVHKVALNPFGKLKRVIDITNKKGKHPIDAVLSSTLAKFTKEENFQVFIKNQTYRNNYHLRLEKNQKMDKKNKRLLSDLDRNNDKMRYIERKIKANGDINIVSK